MKRKKDYTLLALFIPFALVTLFEIGIVCEGDKKPEIKPLINARDYQIETFNDSIVIYDGNRKVGVARWNDKDNHSEIEDIILEDNL